MTGWETARDMLAALGRDVDVEVEQAKADGLSPVEQLVIRCVATARGWEYHLDTLAWLVGAPYGPWRCDVEALQGRPMGILNDAVDPEREDPFSFLTAGADGDTLGILTDRQGEPVTLFGRPVFINPELDDAPPPVFGGPLL